MAGELLTDSRARRDAELIVHALKAAGIIALLGLAVFAALRTYTTHPAQYTLGPLVAAEDWRG